LEGAELSHGDLCEVECRLLESLLPPERRRKSRPAFGSRQAVSGILWRMRAGALWRDLPDQYGKWITVYQRVRRWNLAGIWEVVATTLVHFMADNTHQSMNSTTVWAHVSASGAKGGFVYKILEGSGWLHE
jgi:transposase